MADAYTGTSALSNVITASADMYVRADLRQKPLLRRFADTRPVQVDRPGSSVSLFVRSDLAAATTPLNETTDPDAVALTNPTSTSLTVNEYGNMSIATIKAKAQSFMDVDVDQLDMLAWNMADSLDTLVQTVLHGATNQIWANGKGATGSLLATDNLSPVEVRKAVVNLRTNAAVPRVAELFAAAVHPRVSADLRAATGAGSWQDLHKYAQPGFFWPGCVGVFEGAFFVETSRCANSAIGSGGATVFDSYFMGREALAEGVQIEPEIRIGTIPDKFNRFSPLGWYGMLGWTLFRQKAIYNVQSGSQY